MQNLTSLLDCVFYRDFSWCPTDNMIAYWVPEDENVPARVTIIAMPTRKELCVRNLFSVADCRMHWQKNGDYLCVKVDRYSKSKKVEETGQMKYSVSTLQLDYKPIFGVHRNRPCLICNRVMKTRDNLQ